MTNATLFAGGCLCGAVRYTIDGRPYEAEFCHCRMCQRHAGAMAVAWMGLRAEQVHWSGSPYTEFESSATIRRGFCPTCGCALTYRHIDYPHLLGLTLASLDDPEAIAPQQHIHTASQVSWLSLQDDLPRYPGERPRD